MRYILLSAFITIFSLLAPAGRAADSDAAKGMSDSERAAIEAVVKEYLAKHPDEIVQSLQEMQKREQADAEAKSKNAVAGAKDKIYGDPDTPVGGNPKGSVTVVEFFDYQCGYCKMSETAIEKLLKEDKDVKFVYKNFPILGPMSTVAAKASLASARQGQFAKFHQALMNKKDHLNEEMIYQTAKDAGLDVEKLKKDMKDEAIEKMTQANIKLGAEVGVRGTPLFIVGDTVFPGAMEYAQLKQAVDEARTATKKN